MVGMIISSALIAVGEPLANAAIEPIRFVSIGNPIFPFGDNGLCSQNCPSIGSRAVVDYLSISIVGQGPSSSPRATLNVGDTILILYLGLDNGGYSNWWEAKGTLVSDSSGVRANLGQASASDGNEFENIDVSCDRLFNKCSPSMSWQNVRLDQSFPAGAYSLEVEFTPFVGSSGLPLVTHLLGPAVLTVNAKPSTGSIPQTSTIGGRTCPKLGRIRIDKGVRYACVSSGKKKIWRKMA